MTIPEKIDKIFSMVSTLTVDVAVIKERDRSLEDWKNSQTGKVAGIEEIVESYKIERAKFGLVGKVAIFIFGIFGTITGSILTIIITKYFLQ